MIFKLGLVTRANAEELVQLVAATTRYATEMRFFSRAVRELLMEQLQIHTHRRTQNTRTHRYVANDTSEAQKEPKQHFHVCPRSRSADALAWVAESSSSSCSITRQHVACNLLARHKRINLNRFLNRI